MIRRNSFNLSSEENESNKSEGFYQPKQYRWCKFIVVPLLIAFILLLILTNVDFSREACNKTWLNVKDNKKIGTKRSEETHRPRLLKFTRSFGCFQGDTSCILICHGRNTNNIYKDLEPLAPVCGNTTELYLYNSNFPAGAMKPKFLEGSFHLKTLAIIDCNLHSIEANAFQHDSVSALKTLYLVNTNFVTLSNNTFEGLISLEVLNITNQMSTSNFKGNQFLMPLAKTLRALKMLQVTKANVAYDPLDWLQGSEMSYLREVDLRNNNFQDKLIGKTFANLNNAEVLNLANCSLSYLPVSIFDNMLETLRYLDLSMNDFVTLELQIVRKFGNLTGLYLGDNEWDCLCDNIEFLEILKDNGVNTTDMVSLKCCTPLELRGKDITEILVNCKEETTTLTTTSGIGSSVTGIKPNGPTAMESDTTASVDNTTDSVESIESTTIIYLPSSTDASKTEMQTGLTTTTYTSTLIPAFTSTYSISSTTSHPPYGSIICRDFNRDDTITIDLLKGLTQFIISSYSTTSVCLTLPQDHLNFDLIYFTNYTDAVQWTFRSIKSRHIVYTLLVHGLKMGTPYVFCLVAKNRWSISPFDCKSYYVQFPEPDAWIRKDDQAWIIALVVLGVCLCMFLGVIVIFAIMCRRNRLILKGQTLRHQKTAAPVCRSVSGSSYVNDRILQVPLTKGQFYTCNQLMGQQPEVDRGCSQTNGATTLEQTHYEELVI